MTPSARRLIALVSFATVAAVAPACRGSGGRDAESAPADTAAPTSGVSRGEVPAGGSYGAFAFADSVGGRLLALSVPAFPDSVGEALCRSGTRLAVRFVGRQPRAPDTNGRQRASNFDREEGDVYQVVGGAARPDETCLLVTPTLLALGRPVVPRHATDSTCSDADRVRLSSARSRPLAWCATMATVDGQARVLVTEFERQGDSALASLVLVTAGHTTFLDFPAVHVAGGDTWRVGDGGVFDPSALGVLFVIAGPSASAMAVGWYGEEGESLVLGVTGGPRDAFEPSIRDYRYLLPE